jgi:hypothetical protein
VITTSASPSPATSAGSGGSLSRPTAQHVLQMIEFEELSQLRTIVETLDAISVPVTLEIARDGGRAYGVRVLVEVPR